MAVGGAVVDEAALAAAGVAAALEETAVGVVALATAAVAVRSVSCFVCCSLASSLARLWLVPAAVLWSFWHCCRATAPVSQHQHIGALDLRHTRSCQVDVRARFPVGGNNSRAFRYSRFFQLSPGERSLFVVVVTP